MERCRCAACGPLTRRSWHYLRGVAEMPLCCQRAAHATLFRMHVHIDLDAAVLPTGRSRDSGRFHLL